MNLLVDIGNSGIKWACYDRALERGGTVPLQLPLAERLASAWGGIPVLRGIFVSNVAGPAVADEVVNYCRGHWSVVPEFMTVDRDCNGLVNAYAEIEQLGIDRWLAMLAGCSTLMKMKAMMTTKMIRAKISPEAVITL